METANLPLRYQPMLRLCLWWPNEQGNPCEVIVLDLGDPIQDKIDRGLNWEMTKDHNRFKRIKDSIDKGADVRVYHVKMDHTFVRWVHEGENRYLTEWDDEKITGTLAPRIYERIRPYSPSPDRRPTYGEEGRGRRV